MPVNIRDVAAAAGVSIQTVSNVLNNRAGASEETRLRVLEVARRLGYVRSAPAVALRAQRSTTLGLFFVTTDAGFPSGEHQAQLFAGMTSHLLGASADSPPQLYLSHHPAPDEADLAALERGNPGVLIAAIFVPKPESRGWVEAIQQAGWPTVFLDQVVSGERVACVISDQQQGALEATQHLLRQGHRSIALLTVAQGTADLDERRLGYNRAMALWGIEAAQRMIVETENSIVGGYEAVSRLLQAVSPPTAIVAVNDRLALGAIEAARTAPRRVPEDLAVIGFEDLEFAAHLSPSLTSVRLPSRQMGEVAAQLALAYLRDGRFSEHKVVLPTHLTVRASSVADGVEAKHNGGTLVGVSEPTVAIRPVQPGPFRIGVSLISIDNPWRVSMHEQLQLAGKRDPEIAELLVRDAGSQVDQQVHQIRELVRAGIDALIVDPGAGSALVAPVDEAAAAGIPVIMLASAVPTDRYVCKVGPDEVMVGKIVAEDLIARMGPGNIVVLEGPAGWPVVEDRGRGMALVLRQHREITVLASASVAGWSKERAKQIMHDWLLLFPRIDGVLAHTGLMAMGALEAAQEVGRADNLKLGLCGIYNRVLKYLAETGEGKTVLIPTWIGAECVRVAKRVLQGEAVPKWWDMGLIVVDKNNLSDWYDPSRSDESFESLVHE